MKKKIVSFAVALLLCANIIYAQNCSELVGTWDVTFADNSTGSWTITASVDRTSSFFPCYASGKATVGDNSTDFYLYYFQYLSNSEGVSIWMYTEDLGEMTAKQLSTLLVLDCKAGTFSLLEGENAKNDYNIASVTWTGEPLTCPVEPDPACPLASVLVDDAQSLQLLRQIRDEKLAKSSAGQALIALYYQAAPPLARFIENNPAVKVLLGKTVKAVLPAVLLLK